MRRALTLLACALPAVAAAQAPAPAAADRGAPAFTAIVGGILVNPGAEPIPEAAVLLRGDRIVAVGAAAGVAVPPGARIVDAKGKWITPGLVDGHVHFFQSGGLYTRPDALDLRAHRPYGEELATIRARLPDTFARTLRSGVTAVVDFGGPFSNFEVRAQAAASAAAPRVAVAGPLVSTYQPEALTTDDPPILRVETPEQARALVRRQLERRPDFVKIWYIVRSGETPEQHLPIVAATIDESHRAGVRVAVHATQLATARAAVRAGADVLVHSVEDEEVDDAFLALLREREVVYVPTLMVRERYERVFSQQVRLTDAEWRMADPWVAGTWFDLRHIPATDLPPRLVERIRNPPPVAVDPVLLANLRRVHAAGVTVALGTDAGNVGTPHGPAVFREMELMREAGLSNAAILTAATLHGARLLGRERELGTVEAGKLADLLILDADPLADVGNLAAIHRVVKGGAVFTPEELVPPRPEEVVQRQLNAYNARDLDAFAATYAEDAELFDHPATPLLAGMEALRARYTRRFAEAPELHCRLAGRMVLGSHVLDHELVTGIGEAPVEAVAIYEVEDGLIQRVWFVRGGAPGGG
jgi:imidazolonepropionase-like amidohydrolase